MPVSLNDVCVFLPAIFAVPATLLTSALTYEASGNTFASALAGVFMAVLPAHLMRSVAGGYDNEALAMTIICATFWLWARALRTPASWPIGLLSGLSYVYMAATWGAYTFVLNMIAVHVIVELVAEVVVLEGHVIERDRAAACADSIHGWEGSERVRWFVGQRAMWQGCAGCERRAHLA